MPKPDHAPVEAQEATTITRRWTASGFIVEATRREKTPIGLTLAKHSGAQTPCPRCEKPVQIPPQQLSADELDGLIRLLTGVRDVRLKQLEQFGTEDAS